MSHKEIKFKKYREELYDTIFAARAHYEIWWIYVNANDRPKYLNVLEEYWGFFRIGINAHFVAMIFSLYKLFDKRKDVISIREFQKIVDYLNFLSATDKTEIEKLKCDSILIWEKVSTLRNKHFAHISKSNTYKKVFLDAQIKPDDFKYFIEKALTIINIISNAYDGSAKGFDIIVPPPQKETYLVLNALQSKIQ